MARKKLSNMEILEEAKNALCVCNGEWQERATETLSNNNINIENFKTAIRQALQMGPSKGNNIMLIGPANCGKTFVLNPLKCSNVSFPLPQGNFPGLGQKKQMYFFLKT